LLPFAIGSETWGSILSPANNCGVSGLRPTYGRVSRHGAMALSWTLDKLGPLALTADDCGLILETISGYDPFDASTIDADYHHKVKSKREFRIGIIKGVADDANEEVKRNFERSISELKGFCKIEEIELPDLPYEAISRTILNSEAASAFEEFIESGKTHSLTAPEDHYGLYSRTSMLAIDYLRALRFRRKMSDVIAGVLKPLDAISAPSSKKPATPIDQEFRKVAPGATKDVMGAIGNGAGLPAISIPNGSTESGLPTGIQFMGKAYDENMILAIASKYQRITAYHKRHPLYG
jgi:aspartyl-tRNA(Asn)/glutamyl-tRNA(Gln) amidotransferase subunit A